MLSCAQRHVLSFRVILPIGRYGSQMGEDATRKAPGCRSRTRRPHARTHARTHACTHARTHAPRGASALILTSWKTCSRKKTVKACNTASSALNRATTRGQLAVAPTLAHDQVIPTIIDEKALLPKHRCACYLDHLGHHLRERLILLIFPRWHCNKHAVCVLLRHHALYAFSCTCFPGFAGAPVRWRGRRSTTGSTVGCFVLHRLDLSVTLRVSFDS